MKKTSKTLGVLVLLLSCTALGACAGSGANEPPMTAAAEDPDYASNYPEAVQDTVDRFQSNLEQLDKALAELPKSAEQLREVDEEATLSVIDAADEAGRSEAYSREVDRLSAAQRFFDEEKEQISRRLGGATNYHAKQEGCEVEFYGVATRALEQLIEKRRTERLRAKNPAHTLIDEQRDSLTNQQATTLEELADSISHVSHTIHIGLERQRRELARLADEGGSVESTLNEEIERLKQPMDNADKHPKAAKIRQERLERYQASQQKVARQAEAAKRASSQAEQAVTQWKDRYTEALDKLRSDIEAAANRAESSAEQGA